MIRTFGCVSLLVLLMGCYTLQPIGGVVPELGTQVAMDINDAGRAAVGVSIGQEVGQIEGRLVSKDTGTYTVAVSMVHLIRGSEQVWRGEKVTIRSEHVVGIYQRKFDKGRSMAAGAIGAGLAAVIITRAILGGIFGETVRETPDTTAHSVRSRRP